MNDTSPIAHYPLAELIDEDLLMHKYSQWARPLSVGQLCQVLQCVAQLDAAIFPKGSPRSTFPVLDARTVDFLPRSQPHFESVCLIYEALRDKTLDGMRSDVILERMVRVGTLINQRARCAREPAFDERLEQMLASKEETAAFARMDQFTCHALLSSLGEFQIRVMRAGPRILGAKPYGERFLEIVPVRITNELPVEHRACIEQAMEKLLQAMDGHRCIERPRS